MTYKDEELDEMDAEMAEGLEPYDARADSAARRGVELPQTGHPAGVTETVDMTPELSDIQTIHRDMFPQSLGSKVRNKLMWGRIAPESLLDIIGMGVDSRVMASDPEGDIDVDEMIAEEYILSTIGLDGRGRIDDAELAGAAREAKWEKDSLKGLL